MLDGFLTTFWIRSFTLGSLKNQRERKNFKLSFRFVNHWKKNQSSLKQQKYEFFRWYDYRRKKGDWKKVEIGFDEIKKVAGKPQARFNSVCCSKERVVLSYLFAIENHRQMGNRLQSTTIFLFLCENFFRKELRDLFYKAWIGPKKIFNSFCYISMRKIFVGGQHCKF